jgi:hypothetical protein
MDIDWNRRRRIRRMQRRQTGEQNEDQYALDLPAGWLHRTFPLIFPRLTQYIIPKGQNAVDHRFHTNWQLVPGKKPNGKKPNAMLANP